MIDIGIIGTRLGDIDSLPEELRKQIKEFNGEINLPKKIEIILKNDLEEMGTLDEILVCLYRRYNKIYNRASIYTTLAKMKNRGEIEKVFKGIYKTKEK